MSRSSHGGRHELGQNFLCHRPTIDHLVALTARTSGPILELGSGDGALTRSLARLDRDFTAIDLDERRVSRLRRTLPGVRIEHADALRHPLTADTIVSNIPFHITTPILRRLLGSPAWSDAVLVTQWEVARKRAGVGGRSMMTAQADPWYEFTLDSRVSARHFRPVPSVDGGIITIRRRSHPLVPRSQRREYEKFVKAVFTGRGVGLARILHHAGHVDMRTVRRALDRAGVRPRDLPRDLDANQWASVWRSVRR